jgi:hypothetical protein
MRRRKRSPSEDNWLRTFYRLCGLDAERADIAIARQFKEDGASVTQVDSVRLAMAEAVYKIVAHNGGWGVLHDGAVSGEYITKEAAFEAAVGPASNAIKNGQAVTITVAGSDSGEPSLGKR